MRALPLSLLAIFILSGCGPPSHVIPQGMPSEQQKPLPTAMNSFAALETQIFAMDKQCTGCHSGNKPAADLDLSNYDKILAAKGVVVPGNPEASSLYKEVKSGDMPEDGAPLSASEVQAIADWITAGAPNGSFTVGTKPNPPPPVPTDPTFANVQTQLLAQYCVKCHSGPKSKAKVDVSGYNALMASPAKGLIVKGDAAKSLIYQVIINGKMPPKGATVDANATKLLAEWINAGASNN